VASIDQDQAKKMAVRQHLKELRNVFLVSIIALVAASIAASFYFNEIVDFLYSPFSRIQGLKTEDTLFANMVFEGFLTKLKISVMSGLIVSCPVMVFMIIRFVIPALSRKERRVLFLTIIVSSLLLMVGFYYGYYNILPITIEFFTNNDFLPSNVSFMLSYEKNILYIFRFILMSMLSFLFPVVLEVLMVLNVIGRKTLFRSSRFVIVLIFVLSALITPPDFISQCIIAGPLIVLYFLSILVAKICRFGEV